MRLKAQAIKEALSILRDPRSRMLIIGPPLIQLFIFAFAATLEVKNINLAIYNQDKGRGSIEVMAPLETATFVNEVIYVESLQALKESIELGKVAAGLIIPADFSQSIKRQEAASLPIIVDGRRSNTGQILVSYLQETIAKITFISSPVESQATLVMERHWFNPNLIYRWYIVPALTGILALFSALLITSLSIARERELGTFDQLLVSPSTTLEIIISKLLPALAIGTMLGLFMIIMGIFFFQIPFTGSMLLLVLSLIVFILSVVGLGLMISAVSQTQQQAILGAFALGIPAVLMSGFATPIENMPVFLQWLAQAIPLTHFLIIVEGSFLKSMPLNIILQNLWPLALIATVTLTLTFFFVKKRLE